MLYTLFSEKIQCSDCHTVYVHEGFPTRTPVCPHCDSKEYELYLSSKTIHPLYQTAGLHGEETEDVELVEEYKTRLAFLMVQLKNFASTFKSFHKK